MENKKYTMAELLAEFGDGFDKMEEEEKQEEVIEQVIVEVKEEKKEEPKDIVIKCAKCENDFVWTIKDQEFYKERGFYKPKFCKDCRKKIKVVNNFHKD